MWIVFAIWGVFCAWTVGYCQFHAYEIPADKLTTIFGLPSWVFWGVAVPWCFATTVSVLFALFFIKDHPLEEEPDSQRDENDV